MKNKLIRFNGALTRPLIIMTGIALAATLQQTASASPFGQGNFGADVPFGSATSITVALSGNVNFNLTSNGSNLSGSGSNTVTVTSTDVVGYNLYIYDASGNSNLASGSVNIPASTNTSESALSTNTWGYNTDGSSNYIGITSTPTLLYAASGPYETGNTTTVTYGVLTALSQPEGSYSAPVTFTAVALNQ